MHIVFLLFLVFHCKCIGFSINCQIHSMLQWNCNFRLSLEVCNIYNSKSQGIKFSGTKYDVSSCNNFVLKF